MSLRDEVAFYRACGQPKSPYPKIEGTFPASKALVEWLKGYISKSVPSNGNFLRDADFDGDDLKKTPHLLDSLSETDCIYVHGRPHQDTACCFYDDFDSFLDDCILLKNGSIPEEFYLKTEDYYYPDDSNLELQKTIKYLDDVCTLIRTLKSVAHYHDERTGGGNYPKLIFIANRDKEEARSDSVILEIKLSSKLLIGTLADLKILSTLSKEKGSTDIHYQARVNIFLSSLHEFFGDLDPGKTLEKLIIKWDDFVRLYESNYNIYLSGFAFHKIKKEIANDELTVSGEISKVTRELISKLFAIPLSMGVLIAMSQTNSWIVHAFLIVSLWLTTVLLKGIVDNQKQQLKSVIHSREIIASSYGGSQRDYPKELSEHLVTMNENLDNEIKSAKDWLSFFNVVVWGPLTIAVLYYLVQYADNDLVLVWKYILNM